MLDGALRYRIPIHNYILWQNSSSSSSSIALELPTSEEWAQSDSIKDFLKIFYDATMALSASYHPTVIYFYHHLIKLSDAFAQYSENKSFTLILNAMILKFSKYWGTLSIIFGLAAIIDPRIK